MRVRLLADKIKWKVGETPTFKADVHNGAQLKVYDNRGRYDIYELEFDGRWYQHLAKVRKLWWPIQPGQERCGIAVNLGHDHPWWRSEEPHKPTLTPGKHVIRVAFNGTFGNPLKQQDAKPVRAVSNKIEIEILPPPFR